MFVELYGSLVEVQNWLVGACMVSGGNALLRKLEWLVVLGFVDVHKLFLALRVDVICVHHSWYLLTRQPQTLTTV